MIRLLSAVIRLVAALVLLSWLSVAAQAQGGSVGLLCAPDGVDVGSDFEAEVVVNIGSNVLGAYTVTVVYDPAVFSVTEVAGGKTEQFAARPIVNLAEFPTGRTRISAFNPLSLSEPTGIVSVAEVGVSVLNAVGKSAPIEVEVTTLADIDGARIEDVVTESCTVSFVNGTATPTFTEAVTFPTPSPVSTSTSPHATASPPPLATPTEKDSGTATPTVLPCPGDCNSDHTVTADELVLGVSIALERVPIEECWALDRVADGEVNVDEIVRAVDMALHGCGGRVSGAGIGGADP